MSKSSSNLNINLLFMSVFAVAFAFFESIVVIYTRRILPISDWKIEVRDCPSLLLFLEKHHILWTEQAREVCILIVLITFAIIAGSTIKEKFAYFMLTLGIWLLFRYIFLYSLIKWPDNFQTMDILFLIPGPFIIQVYVPILISIFFLAISGFLLKPDFAKKSKTSQNKSLKSKKT